MAAAETHRLPVSVFHESVKKMEPHPRLSHVEHTLSFMVKGSLQLVHGQLLTVREGVVTLLPAGVPHQVLGGENIEVWGAGFCAACLSLDETASLMRPFRRVRLGAFPIVPIPKAQRRRIVELFRHLEQECEQDHEDAPELAGCLLRLILGEVCRAQQPDSEHSSGSLVADALLFIQQHCFEAISLRDVAKAVHRSPAHVATSVKTATGFSVGRWIAAGKAAEAATRLSHTDDGLDAIAAHVGWQDKTHFIRQFKKIYDVTPAAWRRAQRARMHSSSSSDVKR